MAAYSALQEKEFALEREQGYHAVKHQKFVGAGYFDELMTTITSGQTSVAALAGSTEEEQFAASTS
jgi:isocitrate lyase